MTKEFNMRYSLVMIAALTLAGCNQKEAPPPADPNVKHTVTIQVSDLKDTAATIYVSLYQEGETNEVIKTVSLDQAKNGVVFENIPGGDYAAFIFQDVDGNKELTMNGFMPTEPIGYSNNPQLQGPPQFRDIGFRVAANTTQTVTMLSF